MPRSSASQGWSPPAEFDGFRVSGPVGEGGMGTVYRGEDLALEARALARLVHPNVVQVFRVGEVEGNPYLAYELVEGTTLAGLGPPLPWSFVLDLAIGMARGLAAVHARGLLHRDLKPGNVVVTTAGEPS